MEGVLKCFYAQTKWIAENRQSRNIVYVGHLGDCVQNGDDPRSGIKKAEWKKAGFAISNLENPQLTGLPEEFHLAFASEITMRLPMARQLERPRTTINTLEPIISIIAAIMADIMDPITIIITNYLMPAE